ncbi:MAG: amylo-alpha-1,6-glucosidase [Bacteroidota bacterium]
MKTTVIIILGILFLAGCNSVSKEEQQLAHEITSNENFLLVKEKARELIGSGFTAGDHYGEVWIRDFNTFMDLSCEVADRDMIREKLLLFFNFQRDDGNIIDAYLPKEGMIEGAYEYIFSDLEPTLAAHKNTVETDQETSLLQAVYKYIKKTGEKELLYTQVDGMTVAERMGFALEFLMNHRYNEKYGLIWGGTTADWGDVQPEHEWGVFITEDTHYALDIYDNAMLVIAIKNFIELVPDAAIKWKAVLEELEINIKKHLWDQDNMKFRPHIYLAGSPFPDDFNEDEVFYHGGTAVAIEAGLLSKEEISASLDHMLKNVEETGAGSIGLTMHPPYPDGTFKNPILSTPYTYQNGGDWTWFGGRMIQQLVINGFTKEAYQQILPMTDRVVKNDGFYEWYSITNEPRGSASYRGSAGVLHKAILMLEEWASGVN